MPRNKEDVDGWISSRVYAMTWGYSVRPSMEQSEKALKDLVRFINGEDVSSTNLN